MRALHRCLAVGDLVSFNGEGIGEDLSDLFLVSDCSSCNSEVCSVSEATEVACGSVVLLHGYVNDFC